MIISIIGTGSVGSALGKAFSRAGHQIILGTRNADAPAILALIGETGAKALAPDVAAAAGEVVILALPWEAARAAVDGLGDLGDKIVIDCMNPLGMRDGRLGLVVGGDTSGAEILAGWVPNARIVKTLNQVGADIMADATGFAHPPVMFMASEDAPAKEVVKGLLTDIGFEALDAGGLIQARLLEPFAMVWINQALMQGKGRDWAFAALERRS